VHGYYCAGGPVFVNGSAVPGAVSDNVSTWLDCAGAANPLVFTQPNGGNNGGHAPYPQCPSIVTESGQHVILQQFSKADDLNGNFQAQMVTYKASSPHAGESVPLGVYFEATYKSTNFPPFPGGYQPGPFIGGIGEAPNQSYFEFDGFEINGSGNVPAGFGSLWHNWWGCNPTCDLAPNWNGANPIPHYSGYDGKEYHTVGMRITGDGTTVVKCMWLDGIFQNCVSGAVGQANIQP
jgi:hypothetical protein